MEGWARNIGGGRGGVQNSYNGKLSTGTGNWASSFLRRRVQRNILSVEQITVYKNGQITSYLWYLVDDCPFK